MNDLPLPPLVLALAFMAVFAAAWLLGRHGSARTVRLPRDYYVGLDHLINDRFDRAAEVFARVAASGGDAAEIQFALGSLFRRRGEVDRAIAVHTRLREHGAAVLRDQATFALALDYLSAGLMDRAERLFEELAASREYRREALEQLLRIYEQQGEWAHALKIFHELPADLQSERRSIAAHYLCELAEHAIVQGDAERARVLIRQARNHDERLPRAAVLMARLLENAGDQQGALERYLQSLEAAPELALEIIPRVLALAERLREPQALDEVCARLRRTGRLTPRQLAWLLATALPLEDTGSLWRMSGDAGLASAAGATPSLGELLARIGAAGGRYQCEECGLLSVGWFWRCPKCRSWDGMRPAVFKWADRTDEAARAL
ncbi:MAG TPA: tetratricopeptide repeat protein [Steroidobacteraceae bacterium]|nr:tetratricopeptide repeat protein [Steroidobacteraceae bacterium]